MKQILNSKKLRYEVIGGVTTFFTMAYIVVVNPGILATQGTGMSFKGVLTATVVICFAMTLLMGLYARLPYAVAPGMGINAFFTYTVVLGKGVPWPVALGLTFWAGVLFLVVSLTPLRVKIAQAIPPSLRIAAAGGIGVFLTFIGLKNAGLVTADPATLVKLGKIDLRAALSLAGLALMILLMRRKNAGAFLAGIGVVTVLAWALGLIETPKSFFSAPDFESVFLKTDFIGALKLSLLPVMFSILFTDLFDSISTFVGVSYATGLVDAKGDPKNLREGLIVDAWATLTAGLFGTSSGTAYIESTAGIEAGGRTGMTSVVTALCFLPCLFLAPLAAMVPAYATAPVLILIGALMFRTVAGLPLDKLEDLIPAFLTIVLIPLTFSITQGILWGFLSHVLLYFATGRRKELSPMMWTIAVISLLLLVLENA